MRAYPQSFFFQSKPSRSVERAVFDRSLIVRPQHAAALVGQQHGWPVGQQPAGMCKSDIQRTSNVTFTSQGPMCKRDICWVSNVTFANLWGSREGSSRGSSSLVSHLRLWACVKATLKSLKCDIYKLGTQRKCDIKSPKRTLVEAVPLHLPPHSLSRHRGPNDGCQRVASSSSNGFCGWLVAACTRC